VKVREKSSIKNVKLGVKTSIKNVKLILTKSRINSIIRVKSKMINMYPMDNVVINKKV